MSYLVRFFQRKPHPVAHHVHEVHHVTGALCSQIPTPAVGERTRKGEWELLETLPPDVKICRICQHLKHKLDNPLPERVERELLMLARWDLRAADIQRQKMVTFYRQKQMSR